MKPYYELHITIHARDDLDAIAVEGVVNSMGWKFSKIDGDPELGVGVRCYATIQLNKRHTRAEVLTRLLGGRQHLWAAGCEVERVKIEEVVFDHRGDGMPMAETFASREQQLYDALKGIMDCIESEWGADVLPFNLTDEQEVVVNKAIRAARAALATGRIS